MSKLAGRVTYLGSGILAGAAIAATILKYETLSNIIPDNPQLWIAAITAITGALSAFAAFQVASIARTTRKQATQAAENRLKTAIHRMREFHDAMQRELQSGASEFYKNNATIVFNWNDEVISVGLDAATSYNEQKALRGCVVACRAALFCHKENGHLSRDDLQVCIDTFDEALRLLDGNSK